MQECSPNRSKMNENQPVCVTFLLSELLRSLDPLFGTTKIKILGGFSCYFVNFRDFRGDDLVEKFLN